jgi:cell shape-determining protein MreD
LRRSGTPKTSPENQNNQVGASGVSGVLNDAVVKGIIGNAAFYLFILATFVLLKAMGVTDRLWQALLARIGG